MRAPPLLLSAAALVTACAAPRAFAPRVTAPQLDLDPPVAAETQPAPAPEARPVLQVIPPGDDVHWGGAGSALTVTGRSCETSIVDTEAGRVTARIAACRVWPSPTHDVFLAHMADGTLVTWDRSGARGPVRLGRLASWSPFHQTVAWSPDGTRVALLQGDSLMVLAADPEGESRMVPFPAEARGSFVMWGGDVAWRADSALLTVSNREQVWTVGMASDAPSAVEHRVATTVPHAKERVLPLPRMVDPQWSADGAYVAARREGEMPSLVVFAAGTWTETWRQKGPARGTWSASGARLAVTSEAGLEVLDATTGTTRPLPSATTAWFQRLYQAPDGALMATMVPRDDGRCQAVRIAGKDASLVDLPAEAQDPGWSPDGSRWGVRTATQREALMVPSWRLFVDDRRTKEHTFVDYGSGGFDAKWSARAHRLLVLNGGALLFDADTRRVWRVPVKQPLASAVDADGTRAALETPEGLQLVKLASKEPPVLLSPRGDWPLQLLALSGNHLATVTREGEVNVWNVEERELLASWKAGFVPEHVAWIGEGERLALARRDVLRVTNADGSEGVAVTALRSPAGTSLLVERDPPR